MVNASNVLYLHNKLFSNKREKTKDMCYVMDEPQKHYLRWNKLDIRDHILYDSTYIKCQSFGQKVDCGCLEEWRVETGINYKWAGGTLVQERDVDENVLGQIYGNGYTIH